MVSSEKNYLLKIVIVGDSKTGKSSLIKEIL